MKNALFIGIGAAAGIAVYSCTELIVRAIKEHKQRKQMKKVVSVLEGLSDVLSSLERKKDSDSNPTNDEA